MINLHNIGNFCKTKSQTNTNRHRTHTLTNTKKKKKYKKQTNEKSIYTYKLKYIVEDKVTT